MSRGLKLGTFTVPVDVQRLRALRKAAGFPGRRAFAEELRRRGYTFNYNGVERAGQPSKGKTVNRIKSETAEAVAEALGVEPDEAFPEYSAAKAEMERYLAEDRYKPFSTLAERNAAIVGTMDIAKWAAWKYATMPCEGIPIGRDEAVSCAYETLVEVADQVMQWGLPKGIPFPSYAVSAIRSNIIRKYYGYANTPEREYSFCSLDVFSPEFIRGEYAPDPAELYILMEELEERRTAENCHHKNGGKSHT